MDQLSADQAWTGHILFLLGALCWAGFTVTVRALDIPAFLATAIVGAVSTTWLLPFWLVSDLSNFGAARWSDVVFQAAFQGVISGLISMFAFIRALRLIGSRASALSAMTPGVATLLAIPVLDQTPAQIDVLALAFVVAGLVVWNLAPSSPNRTG